MNLPHLLLYFIPFHFVMTSAHNNVCVTTETQYKPSHFTHQYLGEIYNNIPEKTYPIIMQLEARGHDTGSLQCNGSDNVTMGQN